jgi:hypothetical protein
MRRSQTSSYIRSLMDVVIRVTFCTSNSDLPGCTTTSGRRFATQYIFVRDCQECQALEHQGSDRHVSSDLGYFMLVLSFGKFP